MTSPPGSLRYYMDSDDWFYETGCQEQTYSKLAAWTFFL